MNEGSSSPEDVFTLEHGWQRIVLAVIGLMLAALAGLSLLWRDLDGLAVLGLVIAAGLALLFAVTGQIPWTYWARFRRQANAELEEIRAMRRRLGTGFAIQTLSSVLALDAGTLSTRRLQVSPAPTAAGFQWSAKIIVGDLLVSPAGEQEFQHPVGDRVRPEIRVLCVPSDASMNEALPAAVLKERGASHRDGLLIIDEADEPRQDDVHRILLLAGYRRLRDESANVLAARQLPVRVIGPDFLDQNLALRTSGQWSLLRLVDGPHLNYETTPTVFPAIAGVYTDDTLYDYLDAAASGA